MTSVYSDVRDFRSDEFVGAGDLMFMLGQDMVAVRDRSCAALSFGQRVEFGQGTLARLPFDRVLFARDEDVYRPESPERLWCTEEGLWLCGVTLMISSAGPGGFVEIWHNDRQVVARGPVVQGAASVSVPPAWGAFYGYPGDFVEARIFVLEDTFLEPLVVKPRFWLLKVAGRRRTETLTAPRTWASPDIPIPSDLTTHVQGNIHYLRHPPQALLGHRADQSIPNSAFTVLAMEAPRVDNDSMWSSASPNRITVGEAGLYLVGATALFAENATGDRQLRIRKNGTTTLGEVTGPLGHADLQSGFPAVTLASLAASDYVEAEVWQGSGGALNAVIQRNYTPRLWVAKLGEDATTTAPTEPKNWARLAAVNASDLNSYLRDNLKHLINPPACRAKRTATQAIASDTPTTIGLTAADDFDTDSMHDPVTNSSRITINTAGIYLVGGGVPWVATGAAHRWTRLLRNGSIGNDRVEVGAFPGSLGPTVPVLGLDQYAAGDYIEIAVQQNAGVSVNVPASGKEVVLWAIKVAS